MGTQKAKSCWLNEEISTSSRRPATDRGRSRHLDRGASRGPVPTVRWSTSRRATGRLRDRDVRHRKSPGRHTARFDPRCRASASRSGRCRASRRKCSIISASAPETIGCREASALYPTSWLELSEDRVRDRLKKRGPCAALPGSNAGRSSQHSMSTTEVQNALYWSQDGWFSFARSIAVDGLGDGRSSIRHGEGQACSRTGAGRISVIARRVHDNGLGEIGSIGLPRRVQGLRHVPEEPFPLREDAENSNFGQARPDRTAGRCQMGISVAFRGRPGPIASPTLLPHVGW